MTLIRTTEDLAGAILRVRQEAGLSQRQLAQLVGTTQSAVSRWERGHDEPRFRSLVEIFRACGKRLALDIDVDVDRAQILQQLAMAPFDRLASVANVSRTRAAARVV